MSINQRCQNRSIRFTDSDWAEVKRRAEQAGLTITDYLKDRIFTTPTGPTSCWRCAAYDAAFDDLATDLYALGRRAVLRRKRG